MRPHGNWFARHRIGAFLTLAFGLSWWPWPLALVHPDSVAMLAFGPVVAAVLVTGLADGRTAVVSMARSVVRWRVARSTWAAAAIGPFALAALTGVLSTASGIVEASDVRDTLAWSTWLAVPLLMLSTGLLGGPLFEEVGWRGFLVPHLQRRHPALWSTAAIGSVWATWHLPLLITEPSGQRPPFPFTVWVIAQAILLTWLYNTSRGSVLIAIVFHTAANTAGRLLLEPLVDEASFLAVWWLMAATYVTAALVVIWRTSGHLGTTSQYIQHPLHGGSHDHPPARIC